MSRKTQIQSQFYSWMTKGRWKALLDWFNANEPTLENWTILFEQANRAGVEKHWGNLVDFFHEHLKNRTFKGHQLVNQANAQERFWKTLDAALPSFFVKALPLLSTESKEMFRQRLVTDYTPWLPKKDVYTLRSQRNWMGPIFSTLVALDAFEDWTRLAPLAQDSHALELLRHTRGQSTRWVEHLHEMHRTSRGTEAAWRQGLFRAECIEHLLREPCSLPVTRTLLELAIADGLAAPGQDPCRKFYLRSPYFRVWADMATGPDAQSTRALLVLPEFETPLSAQGQSVGIGKSLGLSLAEILPLLDGPGLMVDDGIEGHVFADLGPK